MFAAGSIVALCVAYLLGSVPTSVWLGQWFYGKDIREYGSGNAGATNTFRVLGIKAGIPVLLFDIGKGWGAVQLSFFFEYFNRSQEVNFQLALGIFALLGHIFPLYVGFRGGKGIATLLGLMIAIHPQAAGFTLLIFAFVFLITRYVSLGSVIAALAFPVIIIFVYKETIPSMMIFSIFIAILVLITHQKNIERLLSREESRARLRLNIRRSAIADEDDIEDIEDPDLSDEND